MNEMLIVWLVVLAVSIIAEIISLGLTSIWFALGAIIPAIFAAFDLPVVLQIITFLVISVALIIFTRPLATKYFNKDRYLTNVESLIGKNAQVIEDIDNMLGKGQAIVIGQEWSARSEEDSDKIQKGAIVEVIAVSGVKLIVREKKGE